MEGANRSRDLPLRRQRTLLFYGALFELALAGVALFFGALFRFDALAGFRLTPRALLWGLGGTLPLLPLLLLFERVRHPAVARIRRLLRELLAPLSDALTPAAALLLAASAGIGEELLFRGLLQGGLAELLGTIPTLLLVSLIFGLLHAATGLYALYAGTLGAYLGILYLLSGSLVAPILAHALYDFVGLLRLRRFGDSSVD